MKHSILLSAACALLLSWLAAPAQAERLRVVATIPDLADLARQIGGERVEVKCLTTGNENLHAVVAKPSMLVALTKADVYVQVGLSLETAFAPGLLETARNERIAPGKPGFISVSTGWQAIEVPASLSRQGGDVHPQGNPHMNLAPSGGRHMAQQVLAGLCAVDPANRAAYEQRCADYLQRLEPAEKRWAELAKRLAGKPIVVYHQEFDYLAAQTGMRIVGSVELKPGIPPTPGHIAELVDAMKQQQVGVILTAAWSHNRQVDDLAEKTGAKVVELPIAVGGAKEAQSWLELMDLVHARLAQAFGIGAARG